MDGNIDENAIPAHCPGTSSSVAGKSSACDGCPNQRICSSTATGAIDPDIDIIRRRIRQCAKRVVLVMSGKGGVGKSTVTSVLARKLASQSLQVGVLDLDLCGPSMPRLFGIEGEPVHQSGSGWSPVYVKDNLAVMSSGLIMPSKESALIWRGPKKNALIKQMLRDVDWIDEASRDDKVLDFLLIDTPPGTSDEHISVVNLLGIRNDSSNNGTGVINGTILVTTPSEISLIDVRRQVNFCRRTSLPILGLVENMGFVECDRCNHMIELFKSDDKNKRSVERLADDFHCGPILCSLPMNAHAASCLDRGMCPLGLDEEGDDYPTEERSWLPAISKAIDMILDQIDDRPGVEVSSPSS